MNNVDMAKIATGIPDWYYDLLAYYIPAIASALIYTITYPSIMNTIIENSKKSSLYEIAYCIVFMAIMYIWGQLSSSYSSFIKQFLKRISKAVFSDKYRDNHKWLDIGAYTHCETPVFIESLKWDTIKGSNRRMLLIAYFRMEFPATAQEILKLYARTKISRGLLINALVFTAISGWKYVQHHSSGVIPGISSIVALIFLIEFIAREGWLTMAMDSIIRVENSRYKSTHPKSDSALVKLVSTS
jgi:hypothetical protein